MTNQIDLQAKLSVWLLQIQKVISSHPKGQFKANGNLGDPFIFEWEFVSPNSEIFNHRIKNASEILVHTYTQLELQFARKFPEAVPNEFFLKSLAPLFQEGEGKVNWVLIEKEIKETFNQFFTTTDRSVSETFLFKSEL